MTGHREDGAGPLPVGHVVASRYTLEEVMGRGRFGWLYRAADPQLDGPVILYVLADGVAAPGGPLAGCGKTGVEGHESVLGE